MTITNDHQGKPTVPASPSAASCWLASTLDALDQPHHPAAYLRPPAPDGRGVLEADVLVRPTDLPVIEATLHRLGYRRRPGWGRRPHRFWLAAAPGAADGPQEWVKVDLVTDVCLGRWHERSTSSAARLLARRRPGSGPWLRPEDELQALLDHVTLDGRRLGDHHRDRLRVLSQTPPQGAEALPRPPAHGPSVPLRRLRNRTARRLSPVLTLGYRWPRTVAIFGTDGSGKSTLAASLAEQRILPVRVLYGGTHPAGQPRSALPGGTTAAIARRLLTTRLQATYHRARGRIVVFDRHPLEGRHLPGGPRARARRRLLGALLPRPALSVILDVSEEVAHQRRPGRTTAALQADRARYRRLAEDPRLPVEIIDGTLPPELVRDQVLALLWARVLPTPLDRFG